MNRQEDIENNLFLPCRFDEHNTSIHITNVKDNNITLSDEIRDIFSSGDSMQYNSEWL
jgi:hypothetical protein